MDPTKVIGAEQWARKDIGKDYKLGERITGPVAQELLEQSGVLDAARSGVNVNVLDSACGTGIVTSLLQAALKSSAESGSWSITCADFSEGMLASLKERADEEEWKNVKDVVVADAQDTKLPSAAYTHVLTSLGFGIFPNSDAALNECDRMLVPGGTLGITTWHYIGWPELVQRGLEFAGSTIVLPDILATYAPRTGYDWSSDSVVEGLLKTRGYEDVRVTVKETTTYATKDEFTSDQMGKISLGLVMRMLPEEQRIAWEPKVLPALKEHWAELFGEDGKYPMKMTMIVATAKRPAV